MSKQWWSSRAGFAVQGGCLLALFAWSVHRAPSDSRGKAKSPAATEEVIDNSEDNTVADNDTAGSSETDARFVAPPTVRFRTEHPPAGSLNLRPVDSAAPERPAPWQPVHPQNPPRRVPGGNSAPRSPFEVNGTGAATVYNAPPPDAD